MNRREFLGAAAACIMAAESGIGLCAADEIEERVAKSRPMAGGKIPSDIAQRIGATHYAGKYCLTHEPFLVEGARKLRELGFGVAKFWLDKHLPGYGFNSDWKLGRDARLVDVARHPYFASALGMGFGCIALEIQPVTGNWRRKLASFEEDEKQIYELSRYLLETYREMDTRFILQHWEGDWMLRDRPGDSWEKERPADVEERCDAMVRWLSARQRGVERARKEVGKTVCRVEHAAEVNRVLDSLKGIPTLCTHVLPKVPLDWVSWSCYDGMGSAADLWHGLEIIQGHAKEGTRVYVGEIGIPENQRTKDEVIEGWDRAMGVFLAREVPYVIHWELYCNEWKGKREGTGMGKANEMRGFWLVRPDGSLSWSGEYLKGLIAKA
jgi:hypothetical protein